MLPPNLCGDLDSAYYQVTRKATALEWDPSEQDHQAPSGPPGLFSLDPKDLHLPLHILATSQFTDCGLWQKDSTTGPHEPMSSPGWLKDIHR